MGYKLLMEQCYWFSRTCIGVAKERCSPKETKGTHWKTAGTYCVGKLKSDVTRLSINRDDLAQIDGFSRAVDAKIQENDKYVSFYLNLFRILSFKALIDCKFAISLNKNT